MVCLNFPSIHISYNIEGLLLLKELTKINPEIGKIVAFAGSVLFFHFSSPCPSSHFLLDLYFWCQGAFEFLLDIMHEEGLGNGGVVVIDCLHVIKNLLRENNLNANHFRSVMEVSTLLSFSISLSLSHPSPSSLSFSSSSFSPTFPSLTSNFLTLFGRPRSLS